MAANVTDRLWSLEELVERTSSEGQPMFRMIKRWAWKHAVVKEFHKVHGLNLRAVGRLMPGPERSAIFSMFNTTMRCMIRH
jgi:hypothetical protein